MNILKCYLLVATLSIVGCAEVSFQTIPPNPTSKTDVNVPEPQPEPQPAPPPSKLTTEDFNFVNKKPELDILVVVDNSTSMYEEQQKLGTRLQSFTDALEEVDWQIGVTTTDVQSVAHGKKGELLNFHNSSSKVLTTKSADFKNKFLKTVVRKETLDCKPDCPSSNEQPLLATMLNIEKSKSKTKQLYRENADLVVVILTDEDELSTGPSYATKPDEVIRTFNNIWPNKNLSAFGVIIEPGDYDCLNSQELDGQFATHVAEFTHRTSGKTVSICESDYAKGMKDIGERARLLINAITLKHTPKLESVKVTVDGEVYENWMLVGQKLLIKDKLKDGTPVKIQYEKI